MDAAVCNNRLCNPPLDVSSLSLGTIMSFIPPTNEASSFGDHQTDISHQNFTESTANSSSSTSSFYSNPGCVNIPWLPISKGNIKKLAQTRFVNSSPNSYRLMPASIESSELDKTSFVEKSSHKSLLPVSCFLEVAKLWALSNRSELECTFTFANSEDLKTTSAFKVLMESDKRRPICHTKPSTQDKFKKNSLSDKSAAEHELLQSVNRFLTSCDKKDKSYVLNQGILDSAGSETRRYLSQIVSLMNENFALKLQNGLSVTTQAGESRKRSSSFVDDVSKPKRTKEGPCVDIFTVPSNELNRSEDDQIVIIRIPTSQRKTSEANQIASGSALNLTKNDAAHKEQQHKCFYCRLSFDDKVESAKHMLTHLTSSLQD